MRERSIWGLHDNCGPGTTDPSGCGFYRVILPLGELGKHGWKTGCSLSMPDYDPGIFLGQRFDQPGVLPLWRALKGHFGLVYEIDDDPFSVDKANWLATPTYHSEDVQAAISECAQLADIVTVTTEPLAEVMRRFNPDVRVINNYVPESLLSVEREHHDMLTIGWAGGVSHMRDVAMIAQTWRDVIDETGARGHFVGADYGNMLRRRGFDFTPWVLDPRRYYENLDFDIGLIPIADHPFARSKCVDSSMRISTDRGVLEAGALEPGMRVWRDGWRLIEAVRRDVPRPGLLLRMEDGYQLRLTPEHRMLVNGEWKPAAQICSGDVIAMEAESAHSGELLRVPWPADGRMSRAYKGRPAADPDAFLTAEDGPRLGITPRWGRFLGAFAGDGSVGQNTTVQISCDGLDQDWIDLLMDDLRAFGLNPRTEEVKTFDGTVLRRRGVRAASAHLLRVLASIGVVAPRPGGTPIRVPCVPEVIWRSPKPVVAEFLAGYFEADGHCSGSGVAVTSKDEQLIRDVQRLLLLFGITSTVRARRNKAQNGFEGLYWQCVLRRAEADVFAKEIGFRSERKIARLAVITGRPHSNGVKPMRWSREVALIEQCAVTPVDIQVEGGTFILAGFVSHNSHIKALEFAALGIPVVASDCEAYREFVVDGVTGFLVSTQQEWREAMLLLVHDGELRAKMGGWARERAASYTIEGNWHRWNAVFEDLL